MGPPFCKNNVFPTLNKARALKNDPENHETITITASLSWRFIAISVLSSMFGPCGPS